MSYQEGIKVYRNSNRNAVKPITYNYSVAKSIITLSSGVTGNAKLMSNGDRSANYIILGNGNYEEVHGEITDSYTLQDSRGMALLIPETGKLTKLSTYIDFYGTDTDVIFEIWKSSTFKDYKQVFSATGSSSLDIPVMEGDSFIVTVRQSKDTKILRPKRIKASLVISS